MDSELTFGADCVIRLEDLGQFKDYTDTIDLLIEKITHLKSQKQPIFCIELLEVIEADPEDTFFLPSFKQLLNLIVDQDWLKYSLKENEIKSLVKFEIAIIEQSLLSFTFNEQIIKKLIQKCHNYVPIPFFQNILLYSLWQLSQKVVYVDDLDAIITLFDYLSENSLFEAGNIELNNIKVAVYLEICQRFLRSHQIRQKFNELNIKDKAIFKCKLSLWNREINQFENCRKAIDNNKHFQSSFLEKTLNFWSKHAEK